MKLSDFKGEKALDVLADIIEPIVEIATDEDVRNDIRADGGKLKVAKTILKKHKSAIIDILAALNGQTANEFAESINILTLPMAIVEVLNDEMLMQAFASQSQTGAAKSFGSASQNTTAKKK